jgi:hypothetical protein
MRACHSPTEAAARLAELSEGLDELIVRIVPVRPTVESVSETLRAATPQNILDAARA